MEQQQASLKLMVENLLKQFRAQNNLNDASKNSTEQNAMTTTEPEEDTSAPVEVNEPFKALAYDRQDILSLKEAAEFFNDESKAISQMPFKPSAGEVYLFKAKSVSARDDWRANGHRFIQANGGRWAYNGGMLKRKIAHCVTPESVKSTRLTLQYHFYHFGKCTF